MKFTSFLLCLMFCFSINVKAESDCGFFLEKSGISSVLLNKLPASSSWVPFSLEKKNNFSFALTFLSQKKSFNSCSYQAQELIVRKGPLAKVAINGFVKEICFNSEGLENYTAEFPIAVQGSSAYPYALGEGLYPLTIDGASYGIIEIVRKPVMRKESSYPVYIYEVYLRHESEIDANSETNYLKAQKCVAEKLESKNR